jgi:membrane fusion protein, multidrug efflux system
MQRIEIKKFIFSFLRLKFILNNLEPRLNITNRLKSGSFILTVFIAVALSGCGKKAPAPGPGGRGRQMGTVPVEVKVLQPELLLNTVFTTGSVMANEKIDLRPEVSGRVTGIFFEEGAIVPKGKLLLKINDSDLRAQLKRNEAQGKMLSDDEFRQKKLLEIKAISQEEYDVAYNQLMVNQADRQLLEAQIAKTEIVAPFTGKIGLRLVSPGSFLASNTIIASLQQLDPVKVEFDVPEKYSSYLKDGLEINFTVENIDSVFNGRVYAQESSIDQETRTLKVRALCQNQAGILKPGTFARINITLEKFADAIKIPSEAVITEITGSYVYKCLGGKANYVPIKTGIRTDNEIQVIQGLVAGDSLIVSGLLQLSNGANVNPKRVNQ